MSVSRFDFARMAMQVEQAREAIGTFDPTQLAMQVEQAREAIGAFDPTQLAMQVEQAREAIGAFDPTQLASQVEQAREAIGAFDPTQLAMQVEQAREAAGTFDPAQLAMQVEQARKAIGAFDPIQLVAQVEQAREAAGTFDPAQLAMQVEQARKAMGAFDPTQLAAQVEQARKTASTLLAAMPPLTPELFGGAWNERVAEAVGRVERTEALAEDIVGAAADPNRSGEALAEDTAIVQGAARPEAQQRVNTRLSWLWRLRLLTQLERLYGRVKIVLSILTFLGVPVPEWPTAEELMTLLGMTAPPDGPPVQAPEWPTSQELARPDAPRTDRDLITEATLNVKRNRGRSE